MHDVLFFSIKYQSVFVNRSNASIPSGVHLYTPVSYTHLDVYKRQGGSE